MEAGTTPSKASVTAVADVSVRFQMEFLIVHTNKERVKLAKELEYVWLRQKCALPNKLIHSCRTCRQELDDARSDLAALRRTPASTSDAPEPRGQALQEEVTKLSSSLRSLGEQFKTLEEQKLEVSFSSFLFPQGKAKLIREKRPTRKSKRCNSSFSRQRRVINRDRPWSCKRRAVQLMSCSYPFSVYLHVNVRNSRSGPYISLLVVFVHSILPLRLQTVSTRASPQLV